MVIGHTSTSTGKYCHTSPSLYAQWLASIRFADRDMLARFIGCGIGNLGLRARTMEAVTPPPELTERPARLAVLVDGELDHSDEESILSISDNSDDGLLDSNEDDA